MLANSFLRFLLLQQEYYAMGCYHITFTIVLMFIILKGKEKIYRNEFG